MRVLLLNAGAKNHGATQEILLTVQSALPCGTVSEIVCLGEQNIKYCMGCKLCYDTCKCVQTDDMESVFSRICAADTLVIAAPSYWADVPGQFKVFIDRCTAYSNTNTNAAHDTVKAGLKCYAIALRTGSRPMECEHIIETIKHWCGHMNIEPAGSMFFFGIADENDIVPHKADIVQQTKAWFA